MTHVKLSSLAASGTMPQVNILDVLRDCAKALRQAAKEADDETDGYAPNLLAAYGIRQRWLSFRDSSTSGI